MPLNEPRVITWWIVMILGALGILAQFVTIPVLSNDRIAFWLVATGFVILILATLLKGV